MNTIWTKILKTAFSPIINDEVDTKLKKIKEDIVNTELNKMSFNQDIANLSGVGKISAKLFPKGVNFETLRQFSIYYPILRACVNYRKRQITGLSWDITPIEVSVDEPQKKSDKENVKKVKDILKYPVGDKTVTFKNFVDKIIEDLIVLDATAIYRRQKRVGGIYGYLPVDAATIELMVHTDGTTPTPPELAYQQKVNGKVVAEMTTDDLIYRVMNPRTNTPYGLSLVETLIIVVTTALKVSSFNLSYLTEGNVPEGFIELPKDIASNQDQLALWQKAWDAMLSGDPRYQRKIKFLPEGMKWNPIRKPEDFQFERFEKWLLQQTCSVMEVAPQAIGFQFDRGKGATESEIDVGEAKGMYPLASLLKEIFDQMIQEDMGYTGLEFVWTNINPTDKIEEANVFAKLVGTGGVSVDEWRIGQGMEPIGLKHYIMTPVGPIFVDDLIKQSAEGNAILPQSYSTTNPEPAGGGAVIPKSPTTPSAKTPSSAEPPKTTSVATKLEKISRIEIVDELKRWKRAAVNDMKQGRGFRDFKTMVIEPRTKKILQGGLSTIKTREEIIELFDPFIARENQIVTSVMDLYDEIQDVVKNERKTLEN